MKSQLLVLHTGGTITQRARRAEDGSWVTVRSTAAPDFVDPAVDAVNDVPASAWTECLGDHGDDGGSATRPVTVSVAAETVAPRSGAELTWDTVFKTADACRIAGDRGFDGVVVVTGTDSLEELAFAVDLLLEPGHSGACVRQVPVVVTGASRPKHIAGYDGVSNVAGSMVTAVALSQRMRKSCDGGVAAVSSLGVLVVMADRIHAARYVRKRESTLMHNMFDSHPGPIGDIRNGVPRFYFTALPPTCCRYARAARRGLLTPAGVASQRVATWLQTVGAAAPDAAWLRTLDGIVVAGMGTGSISAAVTDCLSSSIKESRLRVVLTSRCSEGGNADDHFYKGSIDKYVRRGFVLRDGYMHLDTIKAVVKLRFDLAMDSAGGGGGVTCEGCASCGASVCGRGRAARAGDQSAALMRSRL